MKLKVKERKAVELWRRLDAAQRDELLVAMRRQIAANRITARFTVRKRLRIVGDRPVEKAFGEAPKWRPVKAG